VPQVVEAEGGEPSGLHGWLPVPLEVGREAGPSAVQKTRGLAIGRRLAAFTASTASELSTTQQPSPALSQPPRSWPESMSTSSQRSPSSSPRRIPVWIRHDYQGAYLISS